MSTYLIGDVQGCHQELQRLLSHIGYNPGIDNIWLAGDLINRGPDNLSVIEFAMAEEGVRIVLGNHELHFLALAYGNGKPRRRDTLDDLLNHKRCMRYVDWLRQQPLLQQDADLDITMVHAGIPPNWNLAQASGLADELSDIVRDDSSAERFFNNLYSNEPAHWDDAFSDVHRWQVIANYLTRLRFCTPEGRLELDSKTSEAPPGHAPWFEFNGPAQHETRIVFGHWAALGGVDTNNVIGIDTGCVWGRHLTAWCANDGRRFQVAAKPDPAPQSTS